MTLQGIYAVLLTAEDAVGTPNCWDEVMFHQRKLGIWGFHNLAWHPDLVEAALKTESLKTMQNQGEYMVSFLRLTQAMIEWLLCSHSLLMHAHKTKTVVKTGIPFLLATPGDTTN